MQGREPLPERRKLMIFTSEQVSCGHPDKICDQIADRILTECLKQDRNTRCAAEVLIKDWHIVLAGEITSSAKVDYAACARDVLAEIGLGNPEKYEIEEYIGQQSADIALGTNDTAGGAGDQGMMFGYATDETPELLPIPYVLATQSLLRLRALRSDILRPDAKAQVSYDYGKGKIDTFLISTQHTEDAAQEDIRKLVSAVMHETASAYGLDGEFRILVNPTGRFVIGSSFGDSGVTGRKIIADTYGGMCRHGGGAFSGKDPSKVDRSGAYICRKMARDVICCNLAHKCEIQIAYAIGIPEPVSVCVNTFGTGAEPDDEIAEKLMRSYDLTPKGICDLLRLRDVDYNLTSSYGHFGKDCLPWEQPQH